MIQKSAIYPTIRAGAVEDALLHIADKASDRLITELEPWLWEAEGYTAKDLTEFILQYFRIHLKEELQIVTGEIESEAPFGSERAKQLAKKHAKRYLKTLERSKP